jgi:hypothetical protein
MKTARPLRHGLTATLIAALLSIGVSVEASAQSVATTPVGAVRKTLGTGITPLGVTLLNPDLISTTVTSAGSATLTLNISNVASLLSSTEPYYVEVYTGDLKGDRFDVDVAATLSNNNNTVVLQANSAENTFLVSSIGALLNGATVKLRKHVTIEQLQAAMSAPLVGSNSASVADQVQIFDNSAGAYVSYFLRLDGVTWRRVGTTTVSNKVPIHPGKGIFFSKQGSSVACTMVGAVRTNDFVQKFGTGLQLLSNPWPTDFSPVDYQANAANGWVGDNSASVADQIQVYNPSLSAYESYFLRSDGITWRKVGTTTSVNLSKLLTADSSFFVKRGNSDSGFLFVNNLGL